jgi:hypothetical protein
MCDGKGTSMLLSHFVQSAKHKLSVSWNLPSAHTFHSHCDLQTTATCFGLFYRWSLRNTSHKRMYNAKYYILLTNIPWCTYLCSMYCTVLWWHVEKAETCRYSCMNNEIVRFMGENRNNFLKCNAITGRVLSRSYTTKIKPIIKLEYRNWICILIVKLYFKYCFTVSLLGIHCMVFISQWLRNIKHYTFHIILLNVIKLDFLSFVFAQLGVFSKHMYLNFIINSFRI